MLVEKERVDLIKRFIGLENTQCYLLNQRQAAVRIIPGKRCGIHPAQPLYQREPP
jgi:hypothetical protein